ncbi:sensor histidine kinase [Chryseolinea sp. H1M3-3]|uniref:sensor histidine kinase n=1 Tax=Chryseolinea sp. H1M3-3 TaxID=3034144 RepID=UPI0023ED7F95|nr:sensor histidine kinase [Chryseolinea sp. H1M3-3]
MYRILLFVSFITGSLLSSAQTLQLTDIGKIQVNGQLGYLRDDSQSLTTDDVKNMTFMSINTKYAPNLGFDRAAHWFKLEVNNVSASAEWLLEVAYSPLDQIDLYMVDKDGTPIHRTSGDHFPITARDLPHRHPIFAFEILPGQTRDIFLRVQTISSVQVPIIFWHRDGFLKTSYKVQLLNGLFYGAMVLMILYQLFLFFSVRDKITFYYVLTLVTMVNVVAFFQGYSFLYLYPDYPKFNDILAMVTGPFFLVSSTLLTRAFLNLRHFSNLLDKLLLGNMVLDLGVALLMAVFFRKISFQYHNYLIFIHCLLALISAGYCFHKKYKPARYYLIAWFTVLVAAGIFTISSVGFMPGYLSTNYMGLMGGCILQMLFISFALGDRWSTLEKENQEAKEAELDREHKEKILLEEEVKIRTVEIQQQNVQLEEVNHVKDKLLSVVSHDIRGPLGSLHLALNLVKSGSMTADEFQKVTEGLEARLTHTTEFIDNLLQWAKLQMRGETFEPDRLDLGKLAEESVALLEPECSQKNIRIKNHIQGPLEAYADVNMIRSVFRNLLTNAVKFTKPNGTISIGAYRVDLKIIISVADSGVGIPEKNRNKLFTISSVTTQGTKQEKGTGLGLLLCKEFVEKNGGSIWFETEDGKGTTFYFSLPEFVEESRSAQAN